MRRRNGWFGWGGGGIGWGLGFGRGNPYPFCRRFPWMPRHWRTYGRGAGGYYPWNAPGDYVVYPGRPV